MKILAITGSPRKKGDNAEIVGSFIKGAKSAGHEIEVCRVYDMDFKGCIGCMACTDGKVDVCVHNDDFTKMFQTIVDADCLLFSTPVYFGHMTGPLKTFIDRLYTFLLEDYTLRHLPGKKFITCVTSGAPENMFCESVTGFFKTWFGEFMKLQHVGSLIAGDLTKDGAIKERTEVLQKAEELGKSL